MRTAESRWATALVSALRTVSIVLGGTFVVHRLTLRLAADAAATDEALALDDRGYPRRLLDALTPNDTVGEAMARTLLLAGLAVAIGLLLGWLATVVRRPAERGAVPTDRPVSGLLAGLTLAIAVPGLSWLPLHRFAVDRGLILDGPLPSFGSGGDAFPSIGLWSVLIGVAIAPTIAAALTGGPSWATTGGGGHPALGVLASRPSSKPMWRFGLPALSFGVTLAAAEVISGNGGLVDRGIAALREGRSDDVLGLATPLIVGGALLAPLADLGAAVLRRTERPRVLGLDRDRRGRQPTALAVVLGTLVAVVAIAGWATGPDVPAIDLALTSPNLGGPWLGTDGMGRSLADRTAAALAMTLAASIIPAAAATVVGAGLAFFRRSQDKTTATFTGALLDLFSWPPAIVVPLAAWPIAASTRSLLHPVVLQVTGLLLVPTATRLLVGRPVSGRQRMVRLPATILLLTTTALSIQLLAGFVVPSDGSTWPNLGQLVASGWVSYGTSPWPVLVPLIAAGAAGTSLYWASLALTGLGSAGSGPALIDQTTGWSSPTPDRTALATRLTPAARPAHLLEPGTRAVTLADDAGPMFVEAAPTISLDASDDPAPPADHEDSTEGDSEPAVDPDHEVEALGATEVGALGVTGVGAIDQEIDPTEADREPSDGAEQAEGSEAVEETSERPEQAGAAEGSEEADEADEDQEEPDPDDIPDVSIALAVDAPSPSERSAMEEEASQTVELRPSDLRQAGVRPDDS